MLGTITECINIEKLNKRGKKRLNAKLEHHLARPHTLPYEVFAYIYIDGTPVNWIVTSVLNPWPLYVKLITQTLGPLAKCKCSYEYYILKKFQLY